MSPYFVGNTDFVSETPHYRALESLAKSANQWLALKKTLTNDEGVITIKTLTEQNRVLAATLRLSLLTGTLRLRNQMLAQQLHPSQPKCTLDYLVINNPDKVEKFDKFLIRKSGRELFKHYKGSIVRYTGSTYITDEDK